MPHSLKFAPPVISTGASFHADQAARLLLEEREQLASAELATHHDTPVRALAQEVLRQSPSSGAVFAFRVGAATG